MTFSRNFGFQAFGWPAGVDGVDAVVNGGTGGCYTSSIVLGEDQMKVTIENYLII